MPTFTPVTIPLVVPIDIFVLLLLQVPPGVVMVSPAEPLTHTLDAPMIAVGNGFTVRVRVTLQPVGRIYLITDVPVATPLTMPVPEPIVAMAVLLLSHVPLPGLPLSALVVAGHTCMVPVIAVGKGCTVTVAVTLQPVLVV